MCSNSVEGWYACLNDTVSMLQKIRFCINEGMSVLVPIIRIEYLGNIIDSENMTYAAVTKERDDCATLCHFDQDEERENQR